MFKKDPRQEIEKSKHAVVLTSEDDSTKKVLDYSTSVKMTGNIIATLQNVMSYMAENNLKTLTSISPNPIAMAETLIWVTEQMKEMCNKCGIDISESKTELDLTDSLKDSLADFSNYKKK